MGEFSDRELEPLFDLDEPAGPARPIDATRSAAIIDAALRGAGFPPGGGGGGGGSGGHAAAGGKSAVAAKLALVAGGAAIAVAAWLVVRAPAPPAVTPAPVASAPVARPPESPPPPAPASAAAPPSDEAAAPASVAAPTGASDEAAAPAPDRAPPGAPQPPARPRSRPREHSIVRIVRVVGASRTPAGAEDLLARANAARAAHDWRAADALYRRVARAGAGPSGATGGGNAGLAAQTALVASAELHLEHLGDPAGAARRFRAALTGGAGAALAEDARWGLAESARALGDAAAERRALDGRHGHDRSGRRLAARDQLLRPARRGRAVGQRHGVRQPVRAPPRPVGAAHDPLRCRCPPRGHRVPALTRCAEPHGGRRRCRCDRNRSAERGKQRPRRTPGRAR